MMSNIYEESDVETTKKFLFFFRVRFHLQCLDVLSVVGNACSSGPLQLRRLLTLLC
jgi:uncharacterized protein YxjI